MSGPDNPSLPPPPATLTRLGILGDIHGEEAVLADALKCLAEAEVECILCTGDVVDGAGCADTCVRLLQHAGVLTVAGNHERWLFTNKYRHIPDADSRTRLSTATLGFLASLPQAIEIPTPGGNLLLSHGVGRQDMAQIWPGSERLGPKSCTAFDEVLASGRYRYFVHGHIHYRMVLEFERMTLINAGALKRNLNPEFKPGFMVLDTAALALECYHMNRQGKVAEKGVIPLAKKTQAGRIWRDTQEFDSKWNVFRMTDYMSPLSL